MTQHKFQMVLSYSEKDCQYIAEVPELPQCRGFGWSYAAALAALEHVLEIYRADVKKYEDLAPPRTAPPPIQGARGRTMQLLRARYGDKSLQAFCEEIGQGCDERAFGSALSGSGLRGLRMHIALALDTLPSELWPHRSFTTRKRDDQEYAKRKLSQITKLAKA